MTELNKAVISASEAILGRKSIRAFRDTAVDRAVVEDIILKSSRAPSGGNLQPWKVKVISGQVRDELVNTVAEKMASNPVGDGSEYNVYPPELKDPYRTRRRVVGNDLYSLIGIAKEDRMAKFEQVGKNFTFFGAPVGLIFSIDRQMEQGQFADLGMFMQNVMVLAREAGLHTCAQEAWAIWHQTIRDVVGIPQDELVFCGMCLGYADEEAVINELVSERAPFEEFVEFLGFE